MESFEQLAQQYEPMIHKIINSLNLYKNKEEFYQLSLIALWEASSRFNPEKGNFTNYAYSYIRGKCLTELHKNSKYDENYLYPKEEFWILLKDSSPIQPFEEEVLLSCSETLTPNQRKWLLLTVKRGMSIKEIAQQEHVSVSAVKQWRAGARKKLQMLIDDN